MTSSRCSTAGSHILCRTSIPQSWLVNCSQKELSAASATNLVASILFDEWSGAFVAFTDERCGHGFLDGVASRMTFFESSLLASLWQVCFFSARSTTNHPTVSHQAAKLLVHLDRWVLLQNLKVSQTCNKRFANRRDGFLLQQKDKRGKSRGSRFRRLGERPRPLYDRGLFSCSSPRTCLAQNRRSWLNKSRVTCRPVRVFPDPLVSRPSSLHKCNKTTKGGGKKRGNCQHGLGQDGAVLLLTWRVLPSQCIILFMA